MKIIQIEDDSIEAIAIEKIEKLSVATDPTEIFNVFYDTIRLIKQMAEERYRLMFEKEITVVADKVTTTRIEGQGGM